MKLKRLGGAMTVGLVALISSGCGDGTKRYRELSNINYSETGKVIAKEHSEKSYLNPVDNINPMSKVDPFFDIARIATMTPEKNIVKISYSKGVVAIDNKDLFSRVNAGSPIKVEFTEIYDIRKDSHGQILDKKLSGYKVIQISPIN